MGSSF